MHQLMTEQARIERQDREAVAAAAASGTKGSCHNFDALRALFGECLGVCGWQRGFGVCGWQRGFGECVSADVRVWRVWAWGAGETGMNMKCEMGMQ